MKIRSGFVSNSSSSSYVIVIEKNEFDLLQAQLTDIQKDMIAFLREGKEAQRFGLNDVVALCYMEGNYSTLEDYTPGDGGVYKPNQKKAQEALEENEDATWSEVDEEEDIDYYAEWEIVKEKIDDLPKNKCLQFSVDC